LVGSLARNGWASDGIQRGENQPAAQPHKLMQPFVAVANLQHTMKISWCNPERKTWARNFDLVRAFKNLVICFRCGNAQGCGSYDMFQCEYAPGVTFLGDQEFLMNFENANQLKSSAE
jgi:hypothetical protein